VLKVVCVNVFVCVNVSGHISPQNRWKKVYKVIKVQLYFA